jgi:cytochrome d ubiquinol oxidase subunit II
MVASIGPFWDANETWLVLGVGVLLVAFPQAHGMVLSALYLPVAVMLVGLVLRGVAFDFRVKAHANAQAAVEPRCLPPARWPAAWPRAGCWAAT